MYWNRSGVAVGLDSKVLIDRAVSRLSLVSSFRLGYVYLLHSIRQ